MNKTKKQLLFLTILLSSFLLWQKAEAYTYYVCSSGGNDSNSCSSAQSSSTPKASIASVTLCATNGDTISFCPSGSWSGSTTGCHGTGNPYLAFLCPVDGVSYIGDDTATWGGSGKATLGITAGSSGMVVGINGVDDVTVKGFDININEQNATGIYAGINACTAANPCTGITIDNNTIHDTLSGTQIWNYGIVVGLGGSIVDGVTITNNTIYHISAEPLTIYPTAGSVTNVLVRGNTVYASGEMGDGWNIGLHMKHKVSNVTAEFNNFYNVCHGVSFETEYNYGYPHDITVRYNLIHDLVNYPGCNGITFQDRDVAPISADIYGNIFYGIYGRDISLSSGDNVKVYNNSIYKTASNYAVSATSGSTIDFRNNAIYTVNAEAVYDENGDIDTYSNNVLYRPSGNALRYGSNSYTSAALPSAWGYGTNPAFTGGTFPTGFTGTYGTDMIPNTNYFAVTSGDALNNGTTLSSPYDLSINSAGLANPFSRPQGAAYDIGAYEYASETTDTTPPASPTGLSVQ